ncbi:MAG: ABC transporter permease [Gemmatimonadetes bacterium]|nr:ABC transporter permease [Gemmatimonadota bacterium]NNF12214.1 ABC transporter permease [Gemmatimonadota bacterium]
MRAAPPRVAERLLTLVLGSSEEARTILGDLAEDHARAVRERGKLAAAGWYWKEALSLAVSTSAVGLARGFRVGRGVAQDSRYAVRAIRRDPAFFVFATLIIGLGVGASTAVFSVVSPLLLLPLPMEEPDRLVLVENEAGQGLSGVTSRTSNLRDFRERARTFEAMAGFNAFSGQGSYNMVGTGSPERLSGFEVTHDFLDVLGVAPALGRDFTFEEGDFLGYHADGEARGGPNAVMLTHGFWVRRFGADPAVVGSSLRLNDHPHEVVGVLPPSFDFSSVFAPAQPVDILLPWPITDETDGWGNTTTIVGRLRAGAGVGAAQAELESIVRALQEEQPDRWGLGARVSPLQARIAQPYRPGMLLLVAAAGLLMLIVCVNLSNMLLARSPRRSREMAIRRTMGATRGRLVRQLLLESTLVALSGSIIGLAVAWAAVRHVAGTSGLDVPLLGAVDVDGLALAFSVFVALLTGLAVGAAPALKVGDGDEAEALSGSSRGSTAGPAGRRVRELLVVTEVAMACVLLVLGGLVLRSFQSVMQVDPGFQAEGLVAWELGTSRDFDGLPALMAYYDDIIASVEAVPGVSSVGLVDALPMGRNRTWGSRVVGKEYADDQGESFFPHIVDHRYLSTMEILLVKGRLFTADDNSEGAPVAIVNETAARTMFPGGVDAAIGQKIDMRSEVEIVGIVADVKHRALELVPDNEVYFPMSQVPDFGTLDLVVRSDLPPSVLAASVGTAVAAVDPELPTEDYRTMTSVVERAVSSRRLTLQLLVAFAGSALLLAALGIYAVLSYSVTERTKEIGIRKALGESAGEIRRGLVMRTIGLAVAGIVLGGLTALAGGRTLESLLFGVEPTDPVTFGAMVAIVLGVAFLAALVPAIRASRTDSATALRSAG